MSHLVKLTIVIPARNEREGIGATIRAIPKDSFQRMGYEVDILVVDSSDDGTTAELAKKAGARVIYEPRLGYGRAYKTGFAHTDGEIIATTDADASYPLEDIPQLVKILEEEKLDFLTTNRSDYMENGAMSSLHMFGNAILNLTTRFLFRLNLRDSQSGMWVFRKDLLNSAIIRSNSMSFSEELKIEACHFLKLRWKEVPIQFRRRVGKANIRTWRHGFENLIYLIRKRLRR